MKKIFITICLLLLTYGCDRSPVEKSKIFGTDRFSSERWKESNAKERARMIHSFLITNDVNTMSSSEIYSLLGDSTAYYEYDEFPAYKLLLENSEYIVAFPIDRDTQTIRTVIFEPSLK